MNPASGWSSAYLDLKLSTNEDSGGWIKSNLELGAINESQLSVTAWLQTEKQRVQAWPASLCCVHEQDTVILA